VSELRAFRRLAQVVASRPFDGREILDGACEQVRESFPFETARWLMLEDAEFLAPALEARRASQLDDPQEGPAVVVPLLVGDRCLGFLVADRGGDGIEVDEDELELLTAFGRLVAALVDKASRFELLERHERTMNDFVSLASHELRAPISVVHGISATLYLHGDRLDDHQILELREMLFEQTARVRDLADQLLDLSRLDSDLPPVRLERFSPRERLDQLLPRIAADRLGDLKVRVGPELELTTDASAFDRVASNLILNALRHGLPPVEVTAESGDEFRLVVEDRGEGVEAAFVPQLFERFSRSDASRRSGSSGSGLGLAIAHAFAEALGGTLAYEAVEPRGARFTFALPHLHG
jgi:two-component system sensor histidine kinase MtrB